jgi:large subunit ribosomal protein L11
MQIKLLVDGGAMKPGPALSQKMGPLGMNMGKIIADVNKATVDFKGIKVPVVLDINTKTKEFTVQVFTPPTSELLKKEIGIEKGSPQPNKVKMGNIPLEIVIKVAKVKEKDMMVNGMNEAVDSVLGTCMSLGLLVEGKNPVEVIQEVKEGKYNDLISKGVEQASPEKIAQLNKDFEKIKKSQEAYLKEIEAKKEAKAGEAAAAGAATPAAGAAAPAGGAAPAKAAAPAKEEKGKKKK